MDRPRIWCLRHAQSADNAAGVIRNLGTGSGLTTAGQGQANAAAAFLADKSVASVYSSTAKRAEQTAATIASALGQGVTLLPGLAEYNIGELEGTTDPQDHARTAEVLRTWVVDGALNTRLPGGESGQDVVDRFAEAINHIAAHNPARTAAVISHIGILTIGLATLCPDIRTHLWGRPLPHATPFLITFDGRRWHCDDWPMQPERETRTET